MDDLSRARLLAVEILLADPEALRNDALEADLYLLRDQLQTRQAREQVTSRSPSLATCARHSCPTNPGR